MSNSRVIGWAILFFALFLILGTAYALCDRIKVILTRAGLF